MTDNSFPAQSALGRRWHSTTFRLITVYAVIFSVSVMSLLGFIGWAVTGDMEHETDVVMDWQLIYFDSMPDTELADAIHRRLEHERMHANYYGLFSADGQHIAGDVLTYSVQSADRPEWHDARSHLAAGRRRAGARGARDGRAPQ